MIYRVVSKNGYSEAQSFCCQFLTPSDCAAHGHKPSCYHFLHNNCFLVISTVITGFCGLETDFSILTFHWHFASCLSTFQHVESQHCKPWPPSIALWSHTCLVSELARHPCGLRTTEKFLHQIPKTVQVWTPTPSHYSPPSSFCKAPLLKVLLPGFLHPAGPSILPAFVFGSLHALCGVTSLTSLRSLHHNLTSYELSFLWAILPHCFTQQPSNTGLLQFDIFLNVLLHHGHDCVSCLLCSWEQVRIWTISFMSVLLPHNVEYNTLLIAGHGYSVNEW